MKINKFAFIVLGAFSLQVEHAHALEEVIVSVASYIESSELNASPVDVITGEEFKNIRVSSVAELTSGSTKIGPVNATFATCMVQV